MFHIKNDDDDDDDTVVKNVKFAEEAYDMRKPLIGLTDGGACKLLDLSIFTKMNPPITVTAPPNWVAYAVRDDNKRLTYRLYGTDKAGSSLDRPLELQNIKKLVDNTAPFKKVCPILPAAVLCVDKTFFCTIFRYLYVDSLLYVKDVKILIGFLRHCQGIWDSKELLIHDDKIYKDVCAAFQAFCDKEAYILPKEGEGLTHQQGDRYGELLRGMML